MQGKQILIIDDDERNIFALSAILRSRGFSCAACYTGIEALEYLQKQTPHLILTDMMMPDMDGYEFVQNIKKNSAQTPIPVFAVTAQAMPGDKEKSLAAGADEYISKPIDVDRLMHLLQTYLA